MQQERKNRAFQEMLAAAKSWLAGRSPETLAERAGAKWDPGAKLLSLQSLNQRLEVSTEDWSVRPQPEEWHHLILLHRFRLRLLLGIAGQERAGSCKCNGDPASPGKDLI